MKERILEILKKQRHPLSEEKLLQLLVLPVSEIRAYNDAVEAQIEEIKAKKPYHSFAELLETNDIWEVK